MRWILKSILTVLVTFYVLQAQANEFIGGDAFRIFRDTIGLDFKTLTERESAGRLVFKPFEELNHDERVFWIKIDGSILDGHDYLYLSNYFEKIEAYYPGNYERYSITGKLIPFDERSYSKGFYRNVLKVDPQGGTLYIRIASQHGYAFVNQSLSHLELVSAEELDQNQSQLYTLGVLLLGMELIILIINIVLLYLRPDFTIGTYICVIVVGLLMGFSESEIFVDQIRLSGPLRQMVEIYINVLLIYFFVAFSAYYLNMREYAPRIFRLLTFPFFILVIITAYIGDGQFFPMVASIYFLGSFTLIAVFFVKHYGADRERSAVYLIANIVVFLMAFTILLALNNLLPHRYTTTHLAFIGFVIRDTIFTVYLARHYFQLQNTTLIGEVTIQRLEEEKEQLKRIEQVKTAFFNNVSHELRTPLTLILAPLQSSLESKNLPSEVRKELDLSLKNGKYLLQLVNEMLDLAKLDQGELQLVRRPVEVIQHINNIRDTFVQYAASKEQTLYISHAEHTLTAKIDLDKFEKIIINLLSNAIKYSNGPGSITVKVSADQKDLLIEVEDQGRGISPEELPRIFDRYFQSDEIDKSEGTGIGLSIVREFVTLHGGAVTCKSQPGVGSVFSLRFVDCMVETAYTASAEAPPIVHDPDKQTILIVEDQHDMRDYLGSKFPEYNVALTSNGEAALKKLQVGLQPDLILTDFMMPKMNGYELVQRLRKSESWLHLPVIFLTARTLTEDRLKVLNLGVDDYIIKPFDLNELKIRIKNTIKVGKTRAEASQSITTEMTVESQASFKTKLDSYLFDHLDDQGMSNTDLSHHFNLSERNLYRRVKAVTGQSPASYIKEIRLQKARRLLESSDELTINEIARSCGIDNATYFSKVFKRRFGTTPSKFKKVES